MHHNSSSHSAAQVVLITGAPGSGKTTLGRDLSDSLRVPFIARDDVRGGLFFTQGAWGERPGRVPTSDEAVEAFLGMVETVAGLGVSCVVEYLVRRGRPQDLERIVAVGRCVVLLTWCRDPVERFATRNRTDRLLNRPPVLDALGYAGIDEHAAAATERMRLVAAEMRTDFDLPLLRVNTDDGYDPGLDAIIDFVTGRSPSPK